LEELEVTLRTKELTKFKKLKTDDGGEGSNASRGRSLSGLKCFKL